MSTHKRKRGIVKLDVSTAPVTIGHRSMFARTICGDGPVHSALKAVSLSIQGDPAYVTNGVADLDANGEISALNGQHRENAINALRVMGPQFGELRPFLDAAASAIEAGPVVEAPAVRSKRTTGRKN